MDNNALKNILDLQDRLQDLGEDRPKLAVILKALNIDSRTMQDTVTVTAMNASVLLPEASVVVVNNLFKLGVTIGFKYAIKEYMEKEFGNGSV